MNEYALIGWAFLDVIIVAIAAALYSIGGRSNKWIRRFVAPMVIVGYCAGISRGAGSPLWWAALASYPIYAGAYSLGYGDNSRLMSWIRSKFLVRVITTTAYIFACVGIVASFGAWHFSTLGLLALMVPVVVFISYKNPLPAAMEEFLICFMTTVFVPFLMYVK